MFALAYGAAFGAIQHMPRIVPGWPEVASLPGRRSSWRAASVQYWQEIGGLVGRFALALLVVAIVSRRSLLRLFRCPACSSCRSSSGWRHRATCRPLKIGMFFAGLFAVAQFSFWGNYLPRVYPTHLARHR